MDFSKQILNSVRKGKTLGTIDKNQKTLHVGFGFDSKFARPMGVSLTSLIINNPSINIHAHLFYNNISNEDFLKLETLAKTHLNLCINFYDVNEELIDKLPTTNIWSLAVYYRLMMPIVLSEIDSFLFLDSDIICLNNISDILDYDTQDYIALVVSELNYAVKERIDSLTLNSKQYFNAGMMLINTNNWNNNEISEQAFNLLFKYPKKFPYFDQDVLNILLEERTQYLFSDWNHLTSKKLKKDCLPASVKFLHYIANPKPWKVFYGNDLQYFYLYYENLSPWKGIQLEYPNKYREAKKYSLLLFKNRFIKHSFIWFTKYLLMKFKEKYASN